MRNGPQISSLVPIQTDGAIVTVCIEKKEVLEEAQFRQIVSPRGTSVSSKDYLFGWSLRKSN